MILESIDKVRCHGDPEEHEAPKTSGPKGVVVKKPAPGMTDDDAPEEKFKRHRESEPDQAHGDSLPS
jgi:hypothetical protein